MRLQWKFKRSSLTRGMSYILKAKGCSTLFLSTRFLLGSKFSCSTFCAVRLSVNTGKRALKISACRKTHENESLLAEALSKDTTVLLYGTDPYFTERSSLKLIRSPLRIKSPLNPVPTYLIVCMLGGLTAALPSRS